jgi:acyl-CoA reductase-like NAD-dependent aldehyde dehydrogenase
MSSAVLGLELRVAGGSLHFYDPTTGQNLLSHREAEQARQESEAQAQAALAALRAAEARIAELEARVRAMERPQE